MGVRKLSDGRYRIWIFLGRDAGGRQKRYSEVVRGTKRDAERREREIRRGPETSTFVYPRSIAVAEYLERRLADYGEAAVTDRTLHRYRQVVQLHLIPMLGARPLAEQTPLDIEEAKRYWLREGSRRSKGVVSEHQAAVLPCRARLEPQRRLLVAVIAQKADLFIH